VAHRHVLLIRVPGAEQVEQTSVAVELQGVDRDTVVQHEDHLTGRAPDGGGGRVRALAGGGGGGGGETGGPCAVGGEREAPGAALGGVEVEGSGLVRPGGRRCAAGGQELVDTVECRLLRQRLRGAQGDLGVVGVDRGLLEPVPGDGTGGLRRLRPTPPRPATAIPTGLAQRAQQLLSRLGRPGQQGLALPRRRLDALRRELGRGSGSRAGVDGGGPFCGAPYPGAAPDPAASTRGRSAPAARGWART
jgi:hypothetical protein